MTDSDNQENMATLNKSLEAIQVIDKQDSVDKDSNQEFFDEMWARVQDDLMSSIRTNLVWFCKKANIEEKYAEVLWDDFKKLKIVPENQDFSNPESISQIDRTVDEEEEFFRRLGTEKYGKSSSDWVSSKKTYDDGEADGDEIADNSYDNRVGSVGSLAGLSNGILSETSPAKPSIAKKKKR